jgi:hypothetical protein
MWVKNCRNREIKKFVHLAKNAMLMGITHKHRICVTYESQTVLDPAFSPVQNFVLSR